jgi:hypothetical protein
LSWLSMRLLVHGLRVRLSVPTPRIHTNKDFAKYEYPTSSVMIVRFKRIGDCEGCFGLIDCPAAYYFHVHLVGMKGVCS